MPAKAAHDKYCALDDWGTLDDETRNLWAEVAQAVIDTYEAGRMEVAARRGQLA